MSPDAENKNPAAITLIHNGTEYTDIVPKNYRMDPQTEDLLYADELENGMRVLVDEGRLREDDARDVNNPLILVRNRWCTVKRFRAEETGMYFIGVHDDGDMCIRQTSATSGWLVKKDSIPVQDEEDEEENDKPNPDSLVIRLSNSIDKAFGQPRNQRSGDIETHPEPKNVVSGVFEA